MILIRISLFSIIQLKEVVRYLLCTELSLLQFKVNGISYFLFLMNEYSLMEVSIMEFTMIRELFKAIYYMLLILFLIFHSFFFIHLFIFLSF